LKCRGALKLRPLIPAIGKELAEKREQTEQRFENKYAAVAVLDVGRMNDGMQQEAYRIDEDMPLLAFDLLARVVTGWINADPPFSAPFTLWLSMMQAVGLASRSIASRHST
jgi:hypothetical protein